MKEIRLLEEGLEEVAGFLSNRERGISIPLARITEANDLIYNSMYQGKLVAPHVREFLIKEALTTSDFPYLFGDVLDRQVLASYKAVEPVWKAFVKMSTVRDFRDAYRFAMTGGDQYLEEVGEKGEYLASERGEEKFTLNVKKYGRQFDISWESLINDDLGALRDTPERFARAAVRTEHRIATGLYAGNAVLYGHGNRSANPLTIANLETGLQYMDALTDANGEPILNSAKFLVVVPALRLTAKQILTSTQKMWVYRGDTDAGPTAMPMANVVSQEGLTLIVDKYLPILDTVSDEEAWYLFADPKDIAALEMAHLRGHERPEVCMKASNKVTLGGGAIGPMSGDFESDNVFYRVRICFGGCRLDWRATYMGGYQG